MQTCSCRENKKEQLKKKVREMKDHEGKTIEELAGNDKELLRNILELTDYLIDEGLVNDNDM